MKKSFTAIIALALAIAMGVTIFIVSKQDPIAMIKVVKVKSAVMPSTTVLESNLYYDVIPEANATKNMVKSIDEVKGSISKAYIGPESFLYKYEVDKEDTILGLKKDQVPLRIATDLITYGGARPGDYVDVLYVKPSSNKGAVPTANILLSNVRVVNHVLSDGTTKTLVHNQLYKEDEVVSVTPDNVTVPPMETSSNEIPSAIDLAVSSSDAIKVDKAVAEGAEIKLRVNPWPEWANEIKNSSTNTSSGTPTTEQPDTNSSATEQPVTDSSAAKQPSTSPVAKETGAAKTEVQKDPVDTTSK